MPRRDEPPSGITNGIHTHTHTVYSVTARCSKTKTNTYFIRFYIRWQKLWADAAHRMHIKKTKFSIRSLAQSPWRPKFFPSRNERTSQLILIATNCCCWCCWCHCSFHLVCVCVPEFVGRISHLLLYLSLVRFFAFTFLFCQIVFLSRCITLLAFYFSPSFHFDASAADAAAAAFLRLPLIFLLPFHFPVVFAVCLQRWNRRNSFPFRARHICVCVCARGCVCRFFSLLCMKRMHRILQIKSLNIDFDCNSRKYPRNEHKKKKKMLRKSFILP